MNWNCNFEELILSFFKLKMFKVHFLMLKHQYRKFLRKDLIPLKTVYIKVIEAELILLVL